jgi:hypothetical protein
MPDYFPGLFESLAVDCSFTRVASMFKQRTAFEYRRVYGAVAGRLFRSRDPER